MDDAVSERALKRMPQIRPNFIDNYVPSYCSIINSHKRLEQIRETNKLASVLCDLKSDFMKEKEEKKKRSTKVE